MVEWEEREVNTIGRPREMKANDLSFWAAFTLRDDLIQFGVDALLLFALQLKFGIEDITLTASNSLTEGGDDKKADLVYIDSESGHAVIAQAYMSERLDKKEALANKASDLNTAVSWLLSRPIIDLPPNLKPHAEELRQAIQDGLIKFIHVWYVHNLPESENVRNELTTVEHTADSIIKTKLGQHNDIEIQSLEVGISTLQEWYESISTPILVTEEFTISIPGGFEVSEADWKAYVTSIPARWLYEQFQVHKTKLLSANVREYLGSRNVDKNINNAIKQTAHDNPGHFWVYNNGITALVYEFKEKKHNNEKEIWFKGISIINGAQTVGAIGNLDAPPNENAMVQIRFITCQNVSTVYEVVRFNNTQNKITAPDFRSNDAIQRRLLREFGTVPSTEYLSRRGGHEDVIKRRPNALPSVIAGQALAAFHGTPGVAYHEKTYMWEDDTLYSTYFGEQTTAKHIVFAYSLLKAVEKKKLNLWNKSKDDTLIAIERTQLDFFRKRGSTFLMTAAIARSLEIILNKQIPNLFNLTFNSNLSPEEASNKWSSIVETASAFNAALLEGLSDGFKTTEIVDRAIQTFQSSIAGTKEVNSPIYLKFAEQVL
ncbi:AIPR family protein [Chloroflexota bacterium]